MLYSLRIERTSPLKFLFLTYERYAWKGLSEKEKFFKLIPGFIIYLYWGFCFFLVSVYAPLHFIHSLVHSEKSFDIFGCSNMFRCK